MTTGTLPDGTYAFDVFVSHHPDDLPWVREELLPRIDRAGLRAAVAWRDLAAGKPKPQALEELVRTSRRTVLVLTPAYLSEEWRAFESQMLQTLDPSNRGFRLIPLVKTKCDVPLRIGYLTEVNFTDPDLRDLAWRQLLTALGAPPEAPVAAGPKREEWRLAHPYPMPPNFTGRRSERTLLSAWLHGDGQVPLLAVRALGGFGKSALTWHWLLHDVDRTRWPRVVWWSFYESGARFDRFLEEALAYLGVDSTPLGPRQEVDALLRELRRPGLLLVLDGFERELRALSGGGAAYRGEGEAWEGLQRPEVFAAGEVRTGHERDCTNPVAEQFLRGVATLPGVEGKILMSTRLRPRVLEQHGSLLMGCHELELTQIRPADAVAFFRAQGIRGGRVEIELACEPYGYHPLSLRLLAGLIAQDPRQPGDIEAAQRLDVTGDLVQRQHHVLEQSYASLAPPAAQLLSRVACARGSLTYEATRALLEANAGPAALAALDVDLRDLETRGLLQHDRVTGRYDLHPIVRRYAYARLDAEDRVLAHTRLRGYFASIPVPEEVTRLEDLGPLIEVYHHMVRAGQYDEAEKLFHDQLDHPTYFRFGAYQLQIELLRELFPAGEREPPRLTEASAQATTMNDLAVVYGATGQSGRALALWAQCEEVRARLGDRKGLAVDLGNQSDVYRKLGGLKAAEGALRRAVQLSREVRWGTQEAAARLDIALLLIFRGAWANAEAELKRALRLFEKHKHSQGRSMVWSYRALLNLLQASRGRRIAASPHEAAVARGLAAAKKALDLTEATARRGEPVERDYVQAHARLGAARRLNGQRTEAERHLNEALARCRAINLVEVEADALIEFAQLRLGTDALEEARSLVEQALEIAEPSEYVLQGADAHLVAARIAVAQDRRAAALEHARRARGLATCDGPPDYTYFVAYEEAAALLADLGEPVEATPKRARAAGRGTARRGGPRAGSRP
jgi:tetratricopeptide (TPR) repeat protein